jgi:hypothetical protein
LARRLLSRTRAAALCLGLLVGACKHDHPAPPAPAPAPADSAADSARQVRFDGELKRVQARWQEKPKLGNCAEILREKADIELCTGAASALDAVEQMPAAATSETALPVLATAALSLERLMERARYLSMEDLGRRHLDRDGGVAAEAASARASASAAPAASIGPVKLQRALHGLLREHSALKLTDSPLSVLVQNTARLERDVLRNVAAYLEYAPLPVRRSAFDTVKSLQEQHPQWAMLSHLVREAAVLETDAALKQNLNELASLALPRGKKPD